MARTLKKYYQSLLTSCGYAIAGGASAIFDKSSQLSGAHDDAFAVFISYRHCQPDRTWAKWLHKKLETYRVPKRLMQDRGMPRRIGRVFRDEEELAASPHLSVAIEEALQCSEYLVVICSPRTPSSKWVNKEIERFRAFGRGDHILALLIEGEPGEAFPLALCEIRPGLVDNPNESQAKIETLEPLAADVRPVQGESARYRQRMAKLRLLATVLGCHFDELRQREQERRTRNLSYLTVGLVLLAASFAGLGLYAELNRREAVQNFQIALGAGDTLVTDVAERLRPEAGARSISTDAVNSILTKAQGIFGKLIEVAPNSPAVRDRQAATLRGFAETYGALGKTSERKAQAEQARDFMEEVVAREPRNATWQRDLAVSYSVLGDALQAQGYPDALVYYRKCQLILERLAAQDPSNTRLQRDLVACYSMMGLVLRDQGDVNGALAVWCKLRSTFESLLSRNSNEARLENNFTVGVAAVHSMTETEWFEKDPARYLNTLRAYRETVEHLLKNDSNNPQRLNELASIHNAIGDFLSLKRDLAEALQAYHEAERILEWLAANDPRNTSWQEGLIWSYQGVGRVLNIQNHLDDALKAYDNARTTLERLAAQDPTNARWQHGLAENHFGVGLTLGARHDYTGALAAFRTAQQIQKDLQSREPSNVDWNINLVLTNNAIGHILVIINKYDEALAEYDACERIIENLVAQDPTKLDMQSRLASNLHSIGIVKGRQGDHVAELEALYAAEGIRDTKTRSY